MHHFICTTCGTQYADCRTAPSGCVICEEERQYVKPSGQHWTTLDRLRKTHRNAICFQEPNLIGIGVEPQFGIGQRALLIRSPHGNVLWDCVSLLDKALIEMIQALGGIAAIAVSHPHYYTTMVEWNRAFDAPIHLHSDDRKWIMRPDDSIVYWQGDTHELAPGLTLVYCGGHFAGGAVLHWAGGCEGRGALLSGDIIQVVADRQHVSFMYSYPNFIPLGAAAVRRIVQAVAPFAYDRIYGAFWDLVIEQDGPNVVRRSAERHLKFIAD